MDSGDVTSLLLLLLLLSRRCVNDAQSRPRINCCGVRQDSSLNPLCPNYSQSAIHRSRMILFTVFIISRVA